MGAFWLVRRKTSMLCVLMAEQIDEWSVAEGETDEELQSWVEQEFAGAPLGDKRLAARLPKLVEAIARRPADSLPVACNDAASLEAAYRFFNNQAVTPAAILEPHIRATVKRCEQDTIIAVHDTTVFGYRAGGKRRGLGPHGPCQQFLAHTTLAVRADAARTPLGVLGVKTYIHKGNGGDGTESKRWFMQANAVGSLGIAPSRLVHVMDREADNYDVIGNLVRDAMRFVIRADDDRRVLPENEHAPCLLADALPRVTAVVTREVPVSARTARGKNKERLKRHPPRNARLAHLHMGAMRITLPRPQGHDRSLLKACNVHVVYVWEPEPPSEQPPVRWILYTTEPIDTAEQILAIVDMYRARWRIEELFKALKTGCAFEAKQLEDYEALINALAVYLPIAWRLLHLRSQTSEQPDAPARLLLDADELTVLRAVARPPLVQNPTTRQALLAIAALGGHLKHNGEPGWQTLGRGWDKLSAYVKGFQLRANLHRECDQS